MNRCGYGRKADGTYFDAHAPKLPRHVAIVALSVVEAVGVKTSEHSGFAPVPAETPVITPFATAKLATYCVGAVEQPAAAASVGIVPACTDVYSATDVLHAAIAASVSDIFDLIT